MNQLYRAWVVEKTGPKQFQGSIQSLNTSELPDNDLLVRVRYSSLNYKDALSATGAPGVTKNYPHTPGIDAAGEVAESRSPDFTEGDPVIVTSYDLGMNTSGGYGQYIRVPAGWAVRLPEGMSLKESMIWGTAGFTAAMSVSRIEQAVAPDRGDILVSGASGGVGSLATGILTRLGYSVTAISGKPDTRLLETLGTQTILSREAFLEKSDRPLLKEQWAGVVDTVGGPILAAAIKSARQDGMITCCGNVASPDLPLTVFPFILRGVTLAGIDSQHCRLPPRRKLWKKLAAEYRFDALDTLYEQIPLEGLDSKIQQILNGQVSGRTLVDLE